MRQDRRSGANRFVLSCLLAFLPLAAAAQKPFVGNSTIDVGRTGYQMPVTAVFEFRNKSVRHLRISDVRPDCACTTIDYPKGEIALGQKFQIRMTYDARQLGHFDKQAAVVSNGSSQPVYLRMHGVVLEDYVDLSKHYPVAMGDLHLNKAELEYDDINRGALQVQELLIYNNGTRACRPNLMHLPSYLSAVVTPEKLAPRRVGKITVTLNSANLHDYGLTQTTVYLAANPGDKVSPDHEIGVSAVLLPPFEGLTPEQQAMAPRLVLSDEKVDIHFDGKKKRTATILVSNQGKSDLNISSLQLFTRGLKVSLGKRTLKAGEETKLKITALRDELQKVRLRPRILMITNDPQKSKVTITINSSL